MAGIDPISNVADAAARIIALFKADPNVKQQLTGNLELTDLQGQIQAQLQQIVANTAEAANPSLFVAGWRPFVVWECQIGERVLSKLVARINGRTTASR